WTEMQDKLLGAMPDEEVSEKLNRPLETVRDRRRGLGIPNLFPRHSGTSAKRRSILGKFSERELVREQNHAEAGEGAQAGLPEIGRSIRISCWVQCPMKR